MVSEIKGALNKKRLQFTGICSVVEDIRLMDFGLCGRLF